MRQFKSLLLLLLTIAIMSCDKSDTPPQIEGESVRVLVLANSSASITKSTTALEADTKLTLYVYKRENAETADYTSTPYKVATATSTEATTSHTFYTEGTTELTVATDATYDFIITASPVEGYTVNTGTLSSVTNGTDFLASHTTVTVAQDAESVTVSFCEMDNNNIPHLVSGVSMQIEATKNFLTNVDATNKDINLSFAYADFYRYPQMATLNFASNPLALNIVGSTGSYTLKGDGAKTNITTENYGTDKASYDGYMLPYPLTGAATYNEVDIDFYIGVDDANIMLEAKAVQLPAFNPNYRYTFTMKMEANSEDSGEISLYLSIEDWSDANWNSAMGGTDGSYMNIYVGGWSSVSWNSGMGGNDEDKLITSVTGWSSASWASSMGGTADNGTNN